MSITLDTYKSNGYTVVTKNADKGKYIIYKFYSSGDRSLANSLYIKQFLLDPATDEMSNEQVFLVPLSAADCSALTDDSDGLAIYVEQIASGK